MKKIIFLILMLVAAITLGSCEMPTNTDTTKDLEKIYNELFKDIDINHVTEDLPFVEKVDHVKITYQSNNEKVISNEGKVTRLTIDTKVDVTIKLEYQLQDYKGIITFTVIGLDNTYDDPDDPVNPITTSLDEAVANYKALKKYTLTEEYSYDNKDLYKNVYDVDNTLIKFDTLNYFDDGNFEQLYYLYLINGEISGIVADYDGEYYANIGIDEAFEYEYFYLDIYQFSHLSAEYEALGNNVYRAKRPNDAGKEILGDADMVTDDNGTQSSYSEVFTSVIIELQEINNKYYFSKLTFTGSATINNEAKPFTNVLTFTNINNVNLEYPTNIQADDETISDLYEMEAGDSAYVKVTVAAFYGSYLYVTDETGSIIVYLPKNSTITTNLKVGSVIKVSGTIDIYNNLYELKVAADTDIEILDETSVVKNRQIGNVASINSENMGEVVDLIDVKLGSITLNQSKDTSITLTDSYDNTITLFVKSAQAAQFKQIFNKVDTEQLVTIYNLGVQVYKTNLQLCLTNQTTSHLSSYRLNYKTKIVFTGTSLEEALSDIEITVYGESSNTVYHYADMEIEGTYNKDQAGLYTLTLKFGNYEVEITIKVVAKKFYEHANFKIHREVAKELTNYQPGLPSTGDVNILVIPIKFTNSPAYDLSIVEKGFNGTNADTGWYSLKSYYKEVSYNNLNLNANILSPYETNEKYDTSKGETGVEDYRYFKNAIEYYDNQIDYSTYDQNDDGYIDCVYLLYLAPINYSDNDTLWWAYCYEYYEEEGQTELQFDGVGLDWYLWFSYDFFKEDFNGNTNVSINCETVIHETGHALGLDDYYDYDTLVGPKGGIGGPFMMDYNLGDHDPFSKAILGWIKPAYTFYQDVTMDLKSFATYGDALIVAKNDKESFYDEYYILALYTPTGVNAAKAGTEYGNFSTTGLMIFHVDATTKPAGDMGVIDIFQYNNGNTSHKLIQLVEADGNNDILNDEFANDNDLFKQGDSLKLTWYDGEVTNITITVTELTNTNCKITVNF